CRPLHHHPRDNGGTFGKGGRKEKLTCGICLRPARGALRFSVFPQSSAWTSAGSCPALRRSIEMSNETDKKQKKSLTPSEVPFTAPEILSRYVTDTGKILPRRITGLSAKDQRAVTKQIKRARNMLLMK